MTRDERRMRKQRWRQWPFDFKPRMNANEPGVAVHVYCENNQAQVVTKVYQQSKLESCCFEVILNLGTVLVCEFRYCFEFKDDLVVTDEVRRVLRAQGTAFV